jgi:hypothetical protein
MTPMMPNNYAQMMGQYQSQQMPQSQPPMQPWGGQPPVAQRPGGFGGMPASGTPAYPPMQGPMPVSGQPAFPGGPMPVQGPIAQPVGQQPPVNGLPQRPPMAANNFAGMMRQ